MMTDIPSANLPIGIPVVLVGAVCFGTVYVPTSRCCVQSEALTVQWIMSLGALIVGFIVNTAMGSPSMCLIATAAGTLWTIANTIAQLVIPSLGLAIALVLWSTSNILTGWAAGRFGLFGLRQKLPEHSAINLVGLVIVVFGGSFFAFIKKTKPSAEQSEHETQSAQDSFAGVAKCRSYTKIPKPISVSLAIISGFFFASTVIPVLYIQDHPEQFPSNAQRVGLAFVFSHYLGIFLSSTVVFVTYALAKRNRPSLRPPMVLPSMLSGAIWACGMACLFLANDLLTQTVTYPVLITIPGCVASLWSVFYFKEIKMDRHNSLFLLAAFSLIFVGVVLVFVSRIQF